ncbi:MAG: hypothetical protein COB50_00750 [Thiotrichales bacterium]|nr:MAG: hypothetical protein COB50_00750 [Thiotrichales bacterium]
MYKFTAFWHYLANFHSKAGACMASDYVNYILDLLEPLGGVDAKRMFGGHSINRHGISIGLLLNDVLYLKVDDRNQSDYEEYGSKPFTYDRKDRTIVVSNWELPQEVLEDADLFLEWTEKSYQVALAKNK